MCAGKIILITYAVGIFLSWIAAKVDEELNGFRGETDRYSGSKDYCGYIISILFWPITLIVLIVISLYRILQWTTERMARRIARMIENR